MHPNYACAQIAGAKKGIGMGSGFFSFFPVVHVQHQMWVSDACSQYVLHATQMGLDVIEAHTVVEDGRLAPTVRLR